MRSLNYALVVVSLFLFSQKNATAQNTPIVDVPPAPNSAAIGEYGRLPVGLFTGTVQQNISLYTISTSSLSFPISLDYRSNGIQVRDAGSNVGLGWSLNAGGAIVRTLRDQKDEWSSTRITLPNADFTSQQMNDFLYTATSENNLDGEPDIFSFNFGNYAGKFYLTGTPPNMQAVLVDPSPLKIEFLSKFYSDDIDGIQIKITGPDGTIYSFGGSGAIERNYSRTYGTGGVNIASAYAKTAWYLTNIKLIDNSEINFLYSAKNIFYDGGISQTVSSSLTSDAVNGEQYFKAVHTYPVITRINSATSKVTSIDWKTGKIDFTYSPRFDANSDMDKVDKMVISTKNGSVITPIKQYMLNYLLATTNPVYNNPDNNGIYNDNHKRLFLANLIIASPVGTELNRYAFEYYSPTELPTRLSYAVDYWGYFNGGLLPNGQQNKDLVPKDLSAYDSALYQYPGSYKKAGIIDAFSAVGGNKNPVFQYGVKGMLKRITYPTGGYTDLEYEQHSSGMERPAPLTSVNLSWSPNNTYTTPVIPFDQSVALVPTINFIPTNCDKTAQVKLYYTISVTEVGSNINVPIYINNKIYTPTPYTIEAPASLQGYYARFKTGKSYTISIGVNTSCTTFTANLSFSYCEDGHYEWIQNKPIGGMRLSKVTNYDLTGNKEIKRYYYTNNPFCLTCSSGKARVVTPQPAITYYESLTIPNSIETSNLTATLSSEPLNDLYNSQGSHISYLAVLEGIGDNFEGGAIEHDFNYVEEQPALGSYRDPIPGAPLSNAFGNGEETNTVYYTFNANQFTKIKEIANKYVNDYRISNSITGFRAMRRSYAWDKNPNETYNLIPYSFNSQWRYLASSSETKYYETGGLPSTVVTNYRYDNILHMQPTVIFSILENIGSAAQHSTSTAIKYPQDFTYSGTPTGTAAVLKSMVDKHIWSTPIEEIKSSSNGSRSGSIDGKLTTYKLNGTKVVKDKDYSARFNSSTIYQNLINLTPAIVNSSGQFVYDPHYEQLNGYNVYDTACNVLELGERQYVSSYIREPNTRDVWAKVINSTYSNIAYTNFEHNITSGFTNWNYLVSGIVTTNFLNGSRAYRLGGASFAITTARPLSSSLKYKVSLWRKVTPGATLILRIGTTTLTPRISPPHNGWEYVEATFTGSANALTIDGNYIIDELRLYPVNSRMITYTFKDGVGVTNECNENNQLLFYEYDEFNRLKLTRDQDNNILKKNEYQYQYIQN